MIKFKSKLVISFFTLSISVGFVFLNLKNIDKNIAYYKYKEIKSSKKIKDISLGDNFSIVSISSSNNNDYLYSWGKNDFGQLGIGSVEDSFSPTLIEFPIEGEVKQISTSVNSAGAVITDKNDVDHLFVWGSDSYGQLGLDDYIEDRYVTTPFEVKLPVSGKINNFSFDKDKDSTTLASVTGDDKKDHLFVWGSNSFGQLGLGDQGNSTAYINKPREVELPQDGRVKNLSGGLHNSFMVLTDLGNQDHLYSWGKNKHGELGLGNESDQNIPKEVSFDRSGTITKISFFQHSSTVIRDFYGVDHIFMWGTGSSGELGFDSTTDVDSPRELTMPIQNGLVKSVSLGNSTSSIVITDSFGIDNLFTWGSNTSYELGLGSIFNSEFRVEKPTKVTNPIKGEINNICMYSGNSSMSIVDENNVSHLYMWGNNSNGYLGLNLFEKINSPTELVLIIDVPKTKQNKIIFWLIITFFSLLLIVILILIGYFIKKKLTPSENRKVYTSLH